MHRGAAHFIQYPDANSEILFRPKGGEIFVFKSSSDKKEDSRVKTVAKLYNNRQCHESPQLPVS